MINEDLKAKRKEALTHLASMLRENKKPEDDVFYLHPNEDTLYYPMPSFGL